MKRQFLIILLILTAVMLTCCALITGEDTNEYDEIQIDTDLERMLGYVPYSFLEEKEVWFINFGKAKEIYGIEDVTSIEDAKNLPDDRREALGKANSETGGNIPDWRNRELLPLLGFDGLTADRMIINGLAPPTVWSILEGNFDEELIATKLNEQGYTKTDHGSYSYYQIKGDYDISIDHPLSRMVMAAMNRVAVLDNTIIVSPATEFVTGVFDAMDGNTPSITDNAACRALADSLGDVLIAVMTTPEMTIFAIPQMEEKVKFDFAIPEDWRLLHQYDMAAMGYKAEGEYRYLVIALYYVDEADARADGAEIVKRMGDYNLNTYVPNFDNVPFTELYEPGEPAVRKYADGAVLMIECKLIPEGRLGTSFTMGSWGGPRDMLFLLSDPSPYVID